MLTLPGASQLLVTSSFLVATGLVMVFSASALRAELFIGTSRRVGQQPFKGTLYATA